jgi:beta-1,4-mannosyltransferase
MVTRATRRQVRAIRVLSIPGRRHAQNSYFGLLWDALQGAGIEMVDARTTAALLLKFDILHLHFPEHLVTERPLHSALLMAPIFLCYVATARALGKKFVWTIHEVYPQRRHWLAEPYLKCLHILANAYIFMNRTSQQEFLNRYPHQRRKMVWRIPHSSYPVTQISTIRRNEIRDSLTQGTDCLLVGFLGEIRPYKNPAALPFLPAMDPRGRPLRLVVAGAFHESCDVDDIKAKLQAINANRVVRIDARLSDERLSEMIQSVDVVFMPYLQGWNSGFSMFALACGARILCSALPMFREINENLGSPWIYLFNHNATDLHETLSSVVASISRDTLNEGDRLRLEQFLAETSFEQTAARHVELYRSILSDEPAVLGPLINR